VSRDTRRQGVSRALPLVCSIGSTDPTSGAGIGLDLALNALLGVRSAMVVTGVTAQNSRKVTSVAPLAPKVVKAQLESVWSEARPDAIRVGLIPGAPAIRAVRAFFAAHPRKLSPIILDPVLASTSGRRFAGPKDIAALTKLFEYAELVTPNADEAAVLAGMPVRSVDDAAEAAQRIARRAGCAVLVKGGHLSGGTCFDVLADQRGVVYIGAKRRSISMRGSGCVLAAAIAAYRAHGLSLLDSIERARDVIAHAMRSATPLGSGRPQFDPAGSTTTTRQQTSAARPSLSK
jgi:hydroxymethylpyrimidine kinase/phosphomethylpyrimidine kinase